MEHTTRNTLQVLELAGMEHIPVYRGAEKPLLCEAVTAIAFADPTRAIAAARPDSPTHLYEFAYQSPVADIRAGHAVELPFVFDHLDLAHSLVGPDPDQSVADAMHAAWVRFAKTGDPGWTGSEPHRFG